MARYSKGKGPAEGKAPRKLQNVDSGGASVLVLPAPLAGDPSNSLRRTFTEDRPHTDRYCQGTIPFHVQLQPFEENHEFTFL